MRTANQFINPKTGERYAWPLNHSEETQVTKSRNITDGAATGNMSLIPQQGAATPLVFQWKGTILAEDQLNAFLYWYGLCDQHSIHVVDFAGDEYNVLITEFVPTRKAVAINPRNPGQVWIWEYTMTLRVLNVISGPWLAVAP